MLLYMWAWGTFNSIKIFVELKYFRMQIQNKGFILKVKQLHTLYFVLLTSKYFKKLYLITKN